MEARELRSTPYAIKPISRDRLTEAYILCQLCFPGSYGWDTFLAYFTRARGGFFLAEADGAPAGFAITRTPPFPWLFHGPGEIVLVGVVKEARRLGLGTALVQRCFQHLRRAGVREARLHVAVDNEAAIELYKSMGMEIIFRVSKYYRSGADAWRMAIHW